ncbi:MAG TPA: ABC transporter permease [Blastocatellia bacterium]|nr:ABC transporter permease [Blastocatellia bacterium]
MKTLLQDARYGMRMLLRKPGVTVLAVLTIALGIGLNTAVFSVVNAVLLRPLPYREPSRIVMVEESHQQFQTSGFTYASFIDLAGQAQPFESVGAWRFWNFNLTDGGEPEQVTGAAVSAGFFPTLGVTPSLGRAFVTEEDQPGADTVVILSHALWQRRFGSDPGAVGRVIRVSDISRTVVGVMPPGFAFPNQTELWTPLVAGGDLKSNRRSHLLRVIARLKPGVTVEQAQTVMSAFAQGIEQQNPGVDAGIMVGVTPLQTRLTSSVRTALLVLFGAVGFVLLIACANVASLLLARASTRGREMAVRVAIGAGRWQLVRQMLTESMVLAALGGALGLLLAVWGIDLIVALSPAGVPRLDEVKISAGVLVFTLLVSLVNGLLFGLVPALQATRVDMLDALKDGGRSAGGGTSSRFRQFLIVSEVALAMVLLVGAGLLVNSFVRLLQVNRGFDEKNLLTMRLFLSPDRFREGPRQTEFIRQVLERIKTVPGVSSAGIVNSLPLTGGAATTFEVAGSHPTDNQPVADIRVVDPDYFRTMKIPLLGGRWFTERDTADAPRVMVINETMARRYWPGEDPVGKRVTMRDWGPPLTGEIAGVVGDVKPDGLDAQVRPMIYWPYPQFPSIFNALVIRTDGDPLSVVAAVKSRIWSVDPEQPVSAVRPMEQLLADSVAQRRFNALLLGLFAALALGLAAVGIYGVISHSVAQRTREIGIRMAVGARGGDVLRLVIGQGMTPVLAGVVIGLAGAFALTRLMTTLLFGVNATDPLTFAGGASLLAIVGLLACLVPARRATKVDPMIALRYE